ncbi:type IV pilus assembly protein PilQ [Aeromonas sp. RU39B]|uniref:type IV pilus secretin PilQ n=1 Tax=Aeromonas sp. RU39B TaxID=1907416 RepID=UPI00095597C6|nr:type IV pilus secretin PilQ family protein [Aeromonas sp. RU39B]SIQ45270.1 type IV pilus assembly protein PilQ [Aeromonas sp. RU39B]
MNTGTIRCVKWAVILLLVCQSAWAAPLLQALRVTPVGGDHLVLALDFNEAVNEVRDLREGGGRQLRVHLAGADGRLEQNPLPVNRAGVEKVQVVKVSGGLDVLVALDATVTHQVMKQGKTIDIVLGSAAPSQAGADKPVLNSVRSLDFRRGKEGQGEFLVQLNSTAAALDVKSSGQTLRVRLHRTSLPQEWLSVLNVRDFATPVTRIEASRQGEDALFELAIDGRFDYRYDQSGTMLVVQVARKQADASSPHYGGKPISLNFQNVPVRTVLQIIADFNHFNLVTTDSVTGNITLRLDGVPWEQALDVILKVKGLDRRLDGNILLVAPAEELAAREKQQLESRHQVAELAPLVTEYLQVNYAKASEVAALLASEKTSLLSKRGAVSLDERTNILVIKDTSEVIDNVKRMLSLLDIPVRQVVIEARMVTIDDGYDEALGVRWGVTKNDGHGNSTSGTIEGNDASGNNDGATTARGDVSNRLNVNLPVANAAGSLAFQVARLADGTLLDLELSALEKESKAEIIASPRVTTANQKPAMIEQGTEIPYVESSSSGATSVTFKKAVLSLKVTPQITPDNRVILDLTVTQDTKGETVPTGTGDAVSINAQSITTQVLVDNGETLVLGGIYQQTVKSDVSKVPLLGDIPGLGILFRKTVSENKKRELLIFVTPRIVTDVL